MAKKKETVAKETKAKKKEEPTLTGEPTKEQLEFARIQFIKNWKERKLDEYADILDEAGDDDYIELCKKELNDAIDEVRGMRFVLVEAKEGDKRQKAAQLIKDANYAGTPWENGEWRGVLSLDKMMTESLEKLNADAEADFDVDWSTLMFVFQTMKNPRGFGVESARRIAAWEQYDEEKQTLKDGAEEAVTYSGILRKVNEHVRKLQSYDKKLNVLRNRLDLAYAQVRMKLKIDSVEEFVAFNDAIIGAGLPQNEEEIKEALKD